MVKLYVGLSITIVDKHTTVPERAVSKAMRADTYVWIGTALNSATGYSVRALYAEGVNTLSDKSASTCQHVYLVYTQDKLQMRQNSLYQASNNSVAIETACSAKCLLGCTHLQYSVPNLQIEDTRPKMRISSKFGTCTIHLWSMLYTGT